MTPEASPAPGRTVQDMRELNELVDVSQAPRIPRVTFTETPTDEEVGQLGAELGAIALDRHPEGEARTGVLMPLRVRRVRKRCWLRNEGWKRRSSGGRSRSGIVGQGHLWCPPR